jgi:hypothetical protein
MAARTSARLRIFRGAPHEGAVLAWDFTPTGRRAPPSWRWPPLSAPVAARHIPSFAGEQNSVPIPAEVARRSGMIPPTDSEMISPTVPR